MPPTPEPDHYRAFVALDLDPSLRHAIVRLQHDTQARLARPGIRWIHPDLLHLTLLFFGHLPVHLVPPLESALKSACRGIGSLDLGLAGTGAFPDLRAPRVLWTGVTGDLDRLRSLHRQVTEAAAPFAGPLDARTFQPHLTIGRIRDRLDTWTLAGLRDALAVAATAVLGTWTVDAAHLIRSELGPGGPKYTPLRHFPLA